MIDYKKLFKSEYRNYIDWDYVETLPRFQKLKEAQQNPKWHSEGNAFIHTKRVVEEMEYLLDGNELPLERERMLMASALLHDIGKGECTFQKDGIWHSYNHENVGAEIIEKELVNVDDETKKLIVNLVRNHMVPLQIRGSRKFERKMVEMVNSVNLFDLYWLKCADILGSEQENGGTKSEDISYMNSTFHSTAVKTYIKILNGKDDSQYSKDLNDSISRMKKVERDIKELKRIRKSCEEIGVDYEAVCLIIDKTDELEAELCDFDSMNRNIMTKCDHEFEYVSTDELGIRLAGIKKVRRCKKCGFMNVLY